MPDPGSTFGEDPAAFFSPTGSPATTEIRVTTILGEEGRFAGAKSLTLEFSMLRRAGALGGRKRNVEGRGFVSVGEETRERARAAALDAAVVVALSAKGESREAIVKATGRPNNWVRKVQRLYGLSKDQVYSEDQLLI